MQKSKQPWELLEEQEVEGLGAKRVEALPRALKGVRALAVTLDRSIEPDVRRYSRAHHTELERALQGLSAAERRTLFESAFPGLGEGMERGWQSWERRPVGPATAYGLGYPPFRSPSNQGLLAMHRANWFASTCNDLSKFNASPRWLAEWIGHVASWESDLAVLMAGLLDTPGERSEECMEILQASAKGEHPIGKPSKSVIGAMLSCAKPEAWSFVERLLLAARREEGLRQAILEPLGEAHPEAFRRILQLVLDEGLARFSSVVRAADIWFGLGWDSASGKHVHEQMALAHACLTDEQARDAALGGKDGGAAYLALWSIAFDDLDQAAERAEPLMRHAKPEIRFAAVHLLARAGLPHLAPLMVNALRDADLRVAARAADYFAVVNEDAVDRGAAFQAVEELFRRVSNAKARSLKPIIWPWTARKLGTREVGAALVHLADINTAERLMGHLDKFDAEDRATVARYLGRVQWIADDEGRRDTSAAQSVPHPMSPISEGARLALVKLLGDTTQVVRHAAFDGLRASPVKPDEAERLESLLDRKNSDLRTAGIHRLAKQEDAAALLSAQRLLADRNAERRRAGMALLESLARAERALDGIRGALAEAEGVEPEVHERVRQLCGEGTLPTLQNCLGLIDVSTISPAPAAVDRGYPEVTRAAVNVIESLSRLIEKHKETPIPKADYYEETTLGAASAHRMKVGDTRDGKGGTILLEGVWRQWNRERGPELRDLDGQELTRAIMALHLTRDVGWSERRRWPKGFLNLASDGPELPYADHVEVILLWLIAHEPGMEAWARLFLEGMETAIARGSVLAPWGYRRPPEATETKLVMPFAWYDEVLGRTYGCELSDQDLVRLWRLYRAVDVWGARVWSPQRLKEIAHPPKKKEHWEPLDATAIPRPDVETVLAAAESGAAGEADLVYHMLHAHPGETWGSRGFDELTHPAKLAEHEPPEWVPRVVDRVVGRIVELELQRSDAATDTTGPAQALECTGGMRTALAALVRLNEAKLARNSPRWHNDKSAVLTALMAKARPGAGETPAAFGAAAKQMGVGEERLIDLAVLSPQWAPFVEGALGWEGLVEGVWWIHAHTKDNDWRLDFEVQEARAASIAERTPLHADELKDGAVDVEWFKRVYGALGKSRWERLYAAAKYACGGIGHKRAQLFADAMLGRVKEKEVTDRIKAKRHQDSIRALGLLPLKAGAKGAVLARYRVMQEIRRTSRKHGGSMLQASEKRAVEIGMENLARTGGYPDPVRLQWAMEREEVADLEKGAVTVKSGPVSVTLAIDDQGAPELTVSKEGKALASVPPKVKKEPKIAALTERVRQIRQQASRMRQSLERAMCRGDRFTGGELAELMRHPVLRPMLERLVFVGKGLAGYGDKGGKTLRSHDGSQEPLKASDELRLAHPFDLLRTKAWSKWQRECFDAERVQPFKQVFRELYTLTEREKGDELRSTRYAGHQVQPRQALALLGSRGWVTRPEEGVQKTFHAERLTAWLEFDEAFYTPADVEGLTLEAVRFSTAGRDESLKLSAVPARVFSEVMRDVDLVVSVAHRGGVDPEASESTVEARASLLRETSRLLKLGNVRVEGNRAMIAGSLGDYSVHLGSATVQMMSGGSIWIVPVHAQHRGRLFLPFADQDPKTAEVISKVLLLARDSEIKDPAIREQIARKG